MRLVSRLLHEAPFQTWKEALFDFFKCAFGIICLKQPPQPRKQRYHLRSVFDLALAIYLRLNINNQVSAQKKTSNQKSSQKCMCALAPSFFLSEIGTRIMK